MKKKCQQRYFFVIFTETLLTDWHYTQHYLSLVCSGFWTGDLLVTSKFTKKIKNASNDEPNKTWSSEKPAGPCVSLPQVRPAINIPAGKTEGVFSPFLPGSPTPARLRNYQHCLHLAVTQHWHQGQDLVLIHWHFWLQKKKHSLRNTVNDIWTRALTLSRLVAAGDIGWIIPSWTNVAL